jgi:putative endonuclease
MYFVYVIYSVKLNRFYTGTTDDLDKRIEQHNSAFYPNSFTSKGIPWELKVFFSFENNKTAMDAEKFIKRMKSKIFIENIIKRPELLTEIIDNNARVQLRKFGAASSTKP